MQHTGARVLRQSAIDPTQSNSSQQSVVEISKSALSIQSVSSESGESLQLASPHRSGLEISQSVTREDILAGKRSRPYSTQLWHTKTDTSTDDETDLDQSARRHESDTVLEDQLKAEGFKVRGRAVPKPSPNETAPRMTAPLRSLAPKPSPNGTDFETPIYLTALDENDPELYGRHPREMCFWIAEGEVTEGDWLSFLSNGSGCVDQAKLLESKAKRPHARRGGLRLENRFLVKQMTCNMRAFVCF